MCDKKLVVLLLYHILTSISLAIAQTCYRTGNFTSNSTYGINRNLILLSLATNVSANGGFYTASSGQDPDKVYALALCRGDTSSDSCFRSVNSAVQDILAECPVEKEAISWGDSPPCIIRCANHSIFGKVEVSPVDAGANENDIRSNFIEYNRTWFSLMNRLVEETSMGSSRLKYATGEADFTPSQRLYALMQCTPDLSQSDCEYCLRFAVDYFEKCCRVKQGGYVHLPSCFIRRDFYIFYNSTANGSAPSPSPLSPPSIYPNVNRKDNGGNAHQKVVIIVVTAVISVVLVVLYCGIVQRRKRNRKGKTKGKIEKLSSLQFDFDTITVATNNFSDDHKLGQGGFGAVYKGRLPDGREIAAKRLSRNSEQGELEFKNEILLMAKLQHRNLVRLIGFCLEGEERLLIYEFLHYSSLDNFIFNPVKRAQLNWEMRYKIIEGIARGLLYLHEDSQIRIIHRDLKASNILLNEKMHPQISDFGMARLFSRDQTQGATSKVAGTFGYMAPEYVIQGQFSIKSDVFSFGVLVLEIISGQKNNSFRAGEEAGHLLSYAWKNWIEGCAIDLIDPMMENGLRSDIMRCIHIGLLCVQENAVNRPTMGSVVLMLSSNSVSLPVPSRPAFFMYTTMEEPPQHQQNINQEFSVDDASFTELEPR